jgi:protein-tyrosine-phosphatase
MPKALASERKARQTRISEKMSLFQDLQQRRARVLFVCLANSSRSQMAEALAQSTAGDVLEAYSAGIQPAVQISKRAVAAMADRGILLGPNQTPKNISTLDLSSFDVIVNLSEYRLPKQERLPVSTVVLNRPVSDPMGQGEEAHRQALEQVENVVAFLSEHFRRARDWKPIESSAEDAPQTTPGPPPLPQPQRAAATAGSN